MGPKQNWKTEYDICMSQYWVTVAGVSYNGDMACHYQFRNNLLGPGTYHVFKYYLSVLMSNSFGKLDQKYQKLQKTTGQLSEINKKLLNPSKQTKFIKENSYWTLKPSLDS